MKNWSTTQRIKASGVIALLTHIFNIEDSSVFACMCLYGAAATIGVVILFPEKRDDRR